MLKKVLITILAVIFVGSMSLLPTVNLVDAAAKCACGKDCKCEHCMTGKGECQCKPGENGCTCDEGCKCEHCVTGKGECRCHAGAAVKTKPTSDADYAKTMKSKDGGFKAAYTSDPEAIPVNKMISWKLKVETADGQAVTDAEIEVNGDMPEHGHGLPTQPKVTKNLGDGTYLVEGIKFSMPGWWIMTFTIRAAGKTDSVTFNLQLK
jgi:YtkA-like